MSLSVGILLSEKPATAESFFIIVLPAGEKGRIFGSVSALMIQEILHKDGIEVERKKIDIQSHSIKTVGTYSFVVSLYGGETVSVKLVVEAEEKKESEKSDKRSSRATRSKDQPAKAKKEDEAVSQTEEVKEDTESKEQ